jgi:hypothetical protein
MKIATYKRSWGIGLVLVMGLVWLVVPSYLFVIKNCSIQCDPLLALPIRESLNSFIQNHCLNRPFQSLALASIQKQFPYINQIDARYSYPGVISCLCKAVRPHLIINDKYLFMRDTSVRSRENYAPQICEKLPTITFAQKEIDTLSEECCTCLTKLPLSLFEQFSIYWIDETSLYLQDVLFPSLILRADVHSVLDVRLVAKYDKVKNEIIGQKNYAKQQWVLDVRFKNQVIVAKKGMEGL